MKRKSKPTSRLDAELLDQVGKLIELHRIAEHHHAKFLRLHRKAEADTSCPPLGDKSRHRFMEKAGVDAAAGAWNDAVEKEGKLAEVIMGSPARTIDGIIAKLRVVQLADAGPSDDGLALFVYSEQWLPVAPAGSGRHDPGFPQAAGNQAAGG